MKRIDVYTRAYSAREDSDPTSSYRFFPAEDDTITGDLWEHFPTSDDSSHEFQHIESQKKRIAQFRISVSRLPSVIVNRIYQRTVLVQASPPDARLPKELTDILEAHKFKKQ